MDRKTIGSIGLILLVLASVGCARQYVEPGNVAVQVDLYGSDKGVNNKVVGTGAVWYNPVYTAYYEFPTYNQQAKWTATSGASGVDESLSFNSVEASQLNVDVGMSYHFDSEKVPHIFSRFRKGAEDIMHGFLRQRVQDAFNEHASTMKATDIIGAKKHELLMQVTADLKEELEPEGFTIDAVSFLSSFRVDPQVETSINATITAAQKAVEAENKVKQSIAEAQQAVAKAKGSSEAVLIEAKAKAEANEILAKSLTPELVQYESLQKWDGKLPTVSSGGAVPFITVPQGK